ncbi:MAG: NADH:ubiquinone reductase (Na(+)-transporting) subunit A, partial [Marinilabiliales bacterium]
MTAKEIKIRRGLDIPLKGQVPKADPVAYTSKLFAVQPTDFRMMKPRLMVKEGDAVQCGSPVVQNKLDERMLIVSPVSGTVKAVVRGAKRKLLRIEIESDGNQSCIDFGAIDPASAKKEQLVDIMLKAGIWPFIRQRPYGVIAKPEDTPREIFITGFDSAPLAPNADLIVEGKQKEIQTA